MKIRSKMNLIPHQETLVHATFAIRLYKVTEIIGGENLIHIDYAITLISLAIINILSLAFLHIIVGIDMFST